MKKQLLIINLIIVAFIALYVSNPKLGINATFDGFRVWATALLPALFPFFFFTRILNSLGFVDKLSKVLEPVTKKLYKTPGISAYVYVISILSGYPVGAKITSDLYENKSITYQDAVKITTFTSTSGPLFIVGTVGVGMFGSAKIGVIILIAHLVSALINGLIYRNYFPKTNEVNIYKAQLVFNSTKPVKSLNSNITNNLLEDSMYNSIKSILIIGGYVALSFMLIALFHHYQLLLPLTSSLQSLFNLIKLPNGLATATINGLIEITKGCLDLSFIPTPSPQLKTLFATIVITFGGVSVHLQALTFLKKFNIKLGFYLLQKVTHTIVSAIICFILISFIAI